MSDRNSLRKVYTNYEFYGALLHFLGESQAIHVTRSILSTLTNYVKLYRAM